MKNKVTKRRCHKANPPKTMTTAGWQDTGIIKSARKAFLEARWSEVGATPVALAYRHVLVQRPHLLSGPLFPPGERSLQQPPSPPPSCLGAAKTPRQVQLQGCPTFPHHLTAT
ncbi:hypothetical protein HNY73_006398 [Argiope bruennichi]|uniref:Uncharacterized protein n=1 Tax=Argiope bruennichi TaxID=94029 RepID=A0A8T0FKL8_ARGBR|nr:hypothetical protein HNY73_006398 [Argiope bruennichi]